MTPLDPLRLLGSWELLRWYVTHPDGRVTEPLGPAAEGMVVYAPDGWMSLLLTAGNRAAAYEGASRSPAGAGRSLVAYACRWRVVGRSVEHHVAYSHDPALVGTVQTRRVHLRGRRLEVSTEQPGRGGMRTHRLLWRRAPSPTLPARGARRTSSPVGAGGVRA